MSSSYKAILLSGKNKMVTSGYDKGLGWEGLCVLFIQIVSLMNLTNIPDASLNPIKVY